MMMQQTLGKGKGLSPASPLYASGPLPQAVPPQYPAAQQQAYSGITDDWAFRRATGALAPEADIVAGLMGSVHRPPGKGKGAPPAPEVNAGSSSAQPTGQTASGTSPAPTSAVAGASIPQGYTFDYSGHQPGPWPLQMPVIGQPQMYIPADQYFNMEADPNRSSTSGMNAAGLIGDRPPGAPLPTQPGYQPLPIPLLARHLGSFAPQDWQAEWEPRDRSAEKEPVPKWNGEHPATTLKPWLRDLRLWRQQVHGAIPARLHGMKLGRVFLKGRGCEAARTEFPRNC